MTQLEKAASRDGISKEQIEADIVEYGKKSRDELNSIICNPNTHGYQLTLAQYVFRQKQK